MLITDMEKALEGITKGLKRFGLKVNNSKTELCLFYKHDTAPISVTIGDDNISSTNTMNVLGVLFDMKMTWSPI